MTKFTARYGLGISSYLSCKETHESSVRGWLTTRNAWGAFSLNSHINQHTGNPKVTYNTVKTAKKSAEKMSEKHGTHFSYYKCLFCDGYHIGKNKDNKTEYDKIKVN